MKNLTPFGHLPGAILTGLAKARSYARQCDGPVTVVIAVPQWSGLPAYTVGRTFWSETFEEVARDTEASR